MSYRATTELDLTIRADNGLRRGWTTGSCATAGVKAALILLEDGEFHKVVNIMLPGGDYSLVLPIQNLQKLDDGSVKAEVIKDAGDDPDNTKGAIIFSIVRRNDLGQVRFFAGPGVGTVTEPGIRVPVGEPAINPAPRAMIIQAIEEVLNGRVNRGYDVMIGCENGEAIAKRTFNPRLGIVGGISILGTTGIVEPMSLAAYKASIEVYIRVALAGNGGAVAYLPGNVGLAFAQKKLNLPSKCIVQIANYVGFALDCAQVALIEENAKLDVLWVLGHPGKLAKVLDNVWDTHSNNSAMAMNAIATVAKDIGFSTDCIEQIEKANTVEAIIELIAIERNGTKLWQEIEQRIQKLMQERVANIESVIVKLLSLNGTVLGEVS